MAFDLFHKCFQQTKIKWICLNLELRRYELTNGSKVLECIGRSDIGLLIDIQKRQRGWQKQLDTIHIFHLVVTILKMVFSFFQMKITLHCYKQLTFLPIIKKVDSFEYSFFKAHKNIALFFFYALIHMTTNFQIKDIPTT